MSTLQRRIERAERTVGVESGPSLVPALSILFDWGGDDTVPHFPEPVEEWVTRRRALEQAERARLPYIFIADPYAEYEARHGLEPGTLAKHELRGKVPFAELLAAAGCAADQGEQPCTTD